VTRFALLGVAMTLATSAYAQVLKNGGATSTSTRTRGGASDVNVRRDETPNALNKAATTEPPSKASRGATTVDAGYICIDSRVDLHVRIYINGSYVGTVSPWGDSCAHYGAGDHRMYARAVYADGSASTWGPLAGDATPGFRWTIRP
jgi:hypothetical protein